MIPFEATDWQTVPATTHEGEMGTAIWRTKQYGGIRIRLVEYSANYRSDHWCDKGHIIYCVEGEFTSHHKDGSTYSLIKGMGYQTSDDPQNPHLSASEEGCKLFIVDGDFLK
jgi:hypothetical protein